MPGSFGRRPARTHEGAKPLNCLGPDAPAAAKSGNNLGISDCALAEVAFSHRKFREKGVDLFENGGAMIFHAAQHIL